MITATSRAGQGPDLTAHPQFIGILRVTSGRARGRGWHIGQLKDDRFMNVSRRTGAPQRGQGSPARP